MPDRPEDGIDPELIGRYLASDASEDESIYVRRWLMAHPEAADRLKAFLAHLDDEDARPQAPQVDAEWNALQARIYAHESGAEHSADVHVARAAHTATVRTSPWWRQARTLIAASVVAAAVLAYGTLAHRLPQAQPSVADKNTYETGTGERADLRLPDGTHVRLAPGSHVRVAADFGAPRRDVYLDGEGYFEVVHDEARPFTVYAGNTSVRDIGTAFSVRSYAADSAVQVVVREGIVVVAGVGRLRAGDIGRVSITGETSVQRAVDVEPHLSWTSGRLVYSDAPLADVLADLRRWYGAEVELADTTIMHLPFTGTLADVAPNEAVAQLAATMGLTVQVDGKRIILRPDPRKSPPSP